MKLSISNIAWTQEQDKEVYNLMKKNGFSGVEIAPTRVVGENPYDKVDTASKWSQGIRNEYDFSVPSMQSIWYGVEEHIFRSDDERQELIDYTKKAIDFASAINCHNLVFGCPKNRVIYDKKNDYEKGISFFREIGEYALKKGTVIGMEANPDIYGTDYINDTTSAIQLVKDVESKGFLLNLDLGTMINNKESIDVIENEVDLINHVHVSEPFLKPIVEGREIHKEVASLLIKENYQNYVSIEMGRVEDLNTIEEAMKYISDCFKE